MQKLVEERRRLRNAAHRILAHPKHRDSPVALAFHMASAYLEDMPGGDETTNEIIETFLKSLAGIEL